MRTKYGDTYGELVNVKGIECEFFDIRIDPKSIPEGKFFYEVRHADEDWGFPCQIKRGILVNFYGTLISDIELPLDEQGSMELEKDDFEYVYL